MLTYEISKSQRVLIASIVYFLMLCSACLIIGTAFKPAKAEAQTQEVPGVTAIGEGIYVFDIRYCMDEKDIPNGWAPMLKDFLAAHTDLEVVAIAPCHISGGRGRINSMLVYTKYK